MLLIQTLTVIILTITVLFPFAMLAEYGLIGLVNLAQRWHKYRMDQYYDMQD